MDKGQWRCMAQLGRWGLSLARLRGGHAIFASGFKIR